MKYVGLALVLGLTVFQVPTAPVIQRPIQRISIAAAPLRSWSLMYREFKTEFMDCVYGQEIGDSVAAQWAVLAITKPSQVSDTAVAPPIFCANLGGNNRLVGMAHSHPAGGCNPSWPDVRTFVESGLALSIIVCGHDKLAVYARGANPAGVRCTFVAEADSIPLHCTDPDDARSVPGGPQAIPGATSKQS